MRVVSHSLGSGFVFSLHVVGVVFVFVVSVSSFAMCFLAYVGVRSFQLYAGSCSGCLGSVVMLFCVERISCQGGQCGCLRGWAVCAVCICAL